MAGERSAELITRATSRRLIDNNARVQEQRFQDFKQLLLEILDIKGILTYKNYIINLSQRH
jgi:hypothetical protein